ncbi:MAG: hypothetical protein CMO80_03660 [Verrucomicrobiales bacterium]|nr:hypothetical protein [Verrucomicrobiales bacterium]|tara:strand:- start:1022 stop:2020 length:999 start_codon:yes stop_codon:yes gene_type:complete
MMRVAIAMFMLSGGLVSAQQFYLPTENTSLFLAGNETRFYAPTPGKDWVSGSYGCVRTGGAQFHEGIDILRVNTDRRGEPTDEVIAAADGIVSYANHASGASLYGKYVILKHRIEGIPVFTLYAHLSLIESGIRSGAQVRAGAKLGVMGRTANTRSRIGRDRAHLHFEIAFRANERFSGWYQEQYQGKNDHGNWHGWNFLGLDPTDILRRQVNEAQFSLLNFIRHQKEMFRVLVPKTGFSYEREYRPLMRRNATAERAGIDGYELVINFAGIPCQLIPRSKTEIPFEKSYSIIRVVEEEALSKRCRKLITKERGKWRLTRKGVEFLDLITYR